MGTFSEALSGLRSDVRELRREVREDVSDLRDEMRTELTALRSEVGALKTEKTRARGWIAGALAVTSFLGTLAHWLVPCAVAVVLAGCADFGPNGADSYWHDRWRPVPVLVDASMRPDCVQAAREGVEFWRDMGAPLRAAAVTTDRSVFPNGTLGAIVVTERTLPLGVRGATERRLETRLRSAVVRLARDEECHWAVAAHELGHAQGLNHADEPYMLMYPWGPGGDAVSEAEIEWVRQ